LLADDWDGTIRDRRRPVKADVALETKAVAVPTPSLAVAIPCFNEAAAIEAVISAWREALPDAEIVVFDNNSRDGTGEIARRLGVRVIPVSRQGKGYAVRAIFAELADRDAVILVDGDGTYPASEAAKLLAPVLDGSAEMTVGARRPVAGAGAMSPVRGLGNVLIRAAFFVFIGRGSGDLLSGYRVFSRTFRRSVSLRSAGFEIETELATEAVARGMRIVEVEVPYYPRIAGTESKLRALRDGLRIVRMIVVQSLRLTPIRPFGLLAILLGASVGTSVGWTWGLAVAAPWVLFGILGETWRRWVRRKSKKGDEMTRAAPDDV
jgi:glycosyltransferase involved in cell wall biosynthesis